MTDQRQDKKKTVGLLIFALVLLVNPTVKVVDIFPDFIACFIIVKYLAYPAIRAPYFEEARSAFIKLAALSIAKLPAYYLITFARSNNVQDYDTGVLVTLVFTTIETALLLSAVNYLFLGLFYVGERTDAESLITRFPLNRRKTRTSAPESLKLLVTVFIIVRGAFCLLPEMLLLTQSVDPGIHLQVFRPMRYYPYAIVLAVLLAFIFSIVVAKRACAYIRSISDEGKLIAAIDSLADETAMMQIENKEKSRSVCSTLLLFTVASAMTFELCFDNFGGANLLPHFIFGIIVTVALASASKHTNLNAFTYGAAVAYTVASAVSYFVTIDFIDKHGYSKLVNSVSAKEAYLPVIISAIFEFALLCAMLVLAGIAVRKIIFTHAGADESNPSYSMSDVKYKAKTSRNVIIMTALGILAGLAKLADVVFKYFATLKLVATDGGIGNVVMGLVPWFNTVILVTALAYFLFTAYFLSNARDDVKIKYS